MPPNLPTIQNLPPIHSLVTTPPAPKLIAFEGKPTEKRFWEFFIVEIANDNTRAAYFHAISRFFHWCESRKMTELAQIEPMIVAGYIKELSQGHSKPTVKQHLAAIKMLFDYLVIGQAMPFNPAAPVKGPKHVVTQGKTPILSEDEMRELFASIDTDRLTGLRDRALIGVMFYTVTRVSAVIDLKVEDYYPQGKRWFLRFQEKGGKVSVKAVNHKLEPMLDEYIEAAGIAGDKKGYLFRSARGRSQLLNPLPLRRESIFKMIQRRAKDAGIKTKVCCHGFRARGITTYRKNGGTLEKAQVMADHASPRTTKLYDRTSDEITIDEMERIVL